MNVETAVEIHRKAMQDFIADERVSTTLVPELEKQRGLSFKVIPLKLFYSQTFFKKTWCNEHSWYEH